MNKYIDCPHCYGEMMEPENEDVLCGACKGEGVILAQHRLNSETVNGSCDMCGKNGLVDVEHDVYTKHDKKEHWEYRRSICHDCAAQ